jgi:hypothetical protein
MNRPQDGGDSAKPEGAANCPSVRRNLIVWVGLFFFLVWSLSIHAHIGSAHDRSHMASVESLVHRGTWAIDASPFSHTTDRILVGGSFYSDKLPVLSFVASGIYSVLHQGFGLSLSTEECDFDSAPCHCRAICDDRSDWAYYLLTLTLVGLPSALMLALFYQMTNLFGLDNRSALLLTVTVGLATPVFPSSTVFDNHVPATACLLGALYAVLKARDGQAVRRWLLVGGLLAALAAALDLGLGLFCVAFLGYAAWDHRHQAWPYLLGGLLPVILTVVLDHQIVGNPLPPYLYKPGYDYPGSRLYQTIAGAHSPENPVFYGQRMLFGDHGLFAFNPVLLWAVVAMSLTWRDRASRLRAPALVVGLTSGIFVLYFILFADSIGGVTYGSRWYTAFVPLLFVFVAAKWTQMRLRARYLLFLALAVLSLANNYRGALNPWRSTAPLLWLRHASEDWHRPVDVALSGIDYEEVDPGLLAAFGTKRVDKRWFDASSCLVIAPGPQWLFLGPGTPLDPVLAERMALPIGGSLACSVDLRPALDAYREQLAKSAWVSPVLAPSDGDTLVSVSLPASFGNQLVLRGYEVVGYELPGSPLEAGGELELITAWQVQERPGPPLAIFVHLLDPAGRIAGQFDGLGANLDGLYPGDAVLHVHRIAVSPEAQAGSHWVQVGIYNPETMTRIPLRDHGTDRLLLTPVDVVK